MHLRSAEPRHGCEIWIGCLLVVICLGAYWPVLSADFLSFDDPEYVTENEQVQSGLNRSTIRWAFTTFDNSNWHPLTWLSLIADYQLYGLKYPAGYHANNLLLHIANVLLLFGVLRAMTGMVARSAVVAALFAVHPLHVESVAWISERKDVLSTLFWLLTMAGYALYARRPQFSRYLLVVVAFALGLMAKPMLVTLPFVLLLLDYWPLRRIVWANNKLIPKNQSKLKTEPSIPVQSLRRLLGEKLPLLAMSVGSCLVTVDAQQAALSAIPVGLHFRVLNALLSYFSYVLKMFWPTNLSAFYPHPLYPTADTLVIAEALGVGSIIVIITFLVIRERNHPYLAVGWFWYLGTLVPVIGLMQVGGQGMADRYTYVPLIGLFMAIVWGVADRFPSGLHSERNLALTSAFAIGLCTILSWIQSSYWSNDLTLWQHGVECNGHNYFAQFNVACALDKLGREDEAIGHYRAALQDFPEHVSSLHRLGVLLFNRGQVKEGMQQLARALEIDPNGSQSHLDLGTMLETQGAIDQAVYHFKQAVRVSPDSANAQLTLGMALLRLNETQGAIQHLSSANQLDPSNPEILHNLGVAFELHGTILQALPYYQQAVRCQPTNATYRFSFGEALQESGHTDAAAAEFDAGMHLGPQWAETADLSAQRLLSAAPTARSRAPMAWLLARRVCAATHRQQPTYLNTLAAAEAALGKFDEAIRTAKEAIRVATEQRQPELASKIAQHLQQYEKNQASRDHESGAHRK